MSPFRNKRLFEADGQLTSSVDTLPCANSLPTSGADKFRQDLLHASCGKLRISVFIQGSMLATVREAIAYPFQIPFNTSCGATLSRLQTLPNLVQKGQIQSSGHIKAPLPPTLGGFPGVASIRYYLKCTVKR